MESIILSGIIWVIVAYALIWSLLAQFTYARTTGWVVDAHSRASLLPPEYQPLDEDFFIGSRIVMGWAIGIFFSLIFAVAFANFEIYRVGGRKHPTWSEKLLGILPKVVAWFIFVSVRDGRWCGRSDQAQRG